MNLREMIVLERFKCFNITGKKSSIFQYDIQKFRITSILIIRRVSLILRSLMYQLGLAWAATRSWCAVELRFSSVRISCVSSLESPLNSSLGSRSVGLLLGALVRTWNLRFFF